LFRNWLPWLLKLLTLTRSKPVPLNGGILIIGSLLWDERRQAWRDSRLDMASVQPVDGSNPLWAAIPDAREHVHNGFSRGCGIGRGIVVRPFNFRHFYSGKSDPRLYGLWSRFPMKTLLLRPDPITRLSAVESVLKTYPIHQRNRPAGTPETWLPRVLRSLESLGEGSPIPPWFPLLSLFEFRPFWTILSAHFLSFTHSLRFCSPCNLVHHTVVPASAMGTVEIEFSVVSVWGMGSTRPPLLHRQRHGGRVHGRGGRAGNSDGVVSGGCAASSRAIASASTTASRQQQATADHQESEEAGQQLSALGRGHARRTQQHGWQHQAYRVQRTQSTTKRSGRKSRALIRGGDRQLRGSSVGVGSERGRAERAACQPRQSGTREGDRGGEGALRRYFQGVRTRLSGIYGRTRCL
jgi:hypothetical protein